MSLSQLKQRMLGKNLVFVWSQAPHRMLLTQNSCLHTANTPRLNMPPNPQKPGTEQWVPWREGAEQGKGPGTTTNPEGFAPPKHLHSKQTRTQPKNHLLSDTRCKFGAAFSKDTHCRFCPGSTPFWSQQDFCQQREYQQAPEMGFSSRHSELF